MNLTIEKLTPKLADDYFDFFDNRAFTDDSPYRCYCQMFQLSKKGYEKEYGDKSIDPGELSKIIARRQIDEGDLRGYLAYADGLAIGWCNANDRANYPPEPFVENPFHLPTPKAEKAVVCFEIAPQFRGLGIASALLERVVQDAEAEDYRFVTGFPKLRSDRFEWDFSGPLRLYEKAGFRKTEQKDDTIVMKKSLR